MIIVRIMYELLSQKPISSFVTPNSNLTKNTVKFILCTGHLFVVFVTNSKYNYYILKTEVKNKKII